MTDSFLLLLLYLFIVIIIFFFWACHANPFYPEQQLIAFLKIRASMCKPFAATLFQFNDSFLFGFRLTLHLDTFHFPINNTIENRLGDEETQLPSLSKEIPVSCLPNLSPICLIGSDEMTNHVIYTSSEFEKMQFLRIQVRSITYLLTDILNSE